MKKSWRTTLAGILVIVLAVGKQILNVVDSDPLTTFDLNIVLLSLGIGGGLAAARDNGVSSEDAGAK